MGDSILQYTAQYNATIELWVTRYDVGKGTAIARKGRTSNCTIEYASLIILALNMFQNNINVCRHPII